MRYAWTFMAACAAASSIGPAAPAQQSQSKEGAAVIVEGVVGEVYRSPRSGRMDYLVLIEAARTEMGRGAAAARGLAIPAPGDPVYVHVFQADRDGYAGVPTERTRVRAYLYPRQGGGWSGAFPDWFDQVGGAPVARGPNDSEPAPAPTPERPAPPSGESALATLGVKADVVKVSGRIVLKVSEAIAGGPAQNAGVEPGDVIIGVNREGFSSLAQLSDALARAGRSAKLVVLNIRNNQQAEVPIELAAPAPSSTPSPTPAPSPFAPKRTLGVRVEVVRAGFFQSSLKVTSLEPGGPAQTAGIEVDDILVKAGEDTLATEEALQKAIDKAGESITILVKDHRTNRDTPVEVALGKASGPGSTPTSPGGPPTPPGTAGASVPSLGVQVEPGTADLLPVVKVISVTPGSPAEKAGLERGDAIVGVNDKVIFAPDLFEQAVKTAGSQFTLTVLDVKSGRTTPVKIDLTR